MVKQCSFLFTGQFLGFLQVEKLCVRWHYNLHHVCVQYGTVYVVIKYFFSKCHFAVIIMVHVLLFKYDWCTWSSHSGYMYISWI
jgi:hypothetical protein